MTIHRFGRLAAAVMTTMLVMTLAPLPVAAASPPANDDWRAATLVSAVPFSASIDTSLATEMGDSFNFCGGGSKTVWYRIELAAGARVLVSTAGSDYDTVIDAYDWFDPPGGFASRGCDDNGGPNGTSQLTLDIAAGQVTAIMVSSPSGLEGGQLTLSITVVPPPGNDDIDAATPVAPLPFDDSVDTGTATSASDDPQSSCGGQGPSVWYDFTPTTSGRYAISTEGSGYDTLLTLYTGVRGALTEAACDDNFLPIGSYQARLRFDAVAGTTYHVAVTWGGGQYPPGGALRFAVATAPPPPTNDDQASAISMAPLPFNHDVDASEATIASDDPAPTCSGPLESTVWYTLRPTVSERIDIGVRGGDFGPTVAAYTGTRAALTEIACSQGGTTPGFTLDAVAGTTYRVMVGGATGDAGTLHVEASVAFVARLTIAGGSVDAKTGVATVTGTISCNRHSYVSTTSGELSQKVGRFTLRGPIGVWLECDGTVPWSSTSSNPAGPFVPGKAVASLAVYAYDSAGGSVSQPSVVKTITMTAKRR